MLFGFTSFYSSLLLFLVQPIIVKAVLPWFGGSAGVWTSAMLFFQVLLFLGYVYAHWTTQHLKARPQIILHIALLAASLLLLPIAPSAQWKPDGSGEPIIRILVVLMISVGAPYFLLASTGPLVQAWYARRGGTPLPYRLFAVSNAASLAGLVAYPVIVEPFVSNRHQMSAWSAAYAGFAALAGLTGWLSRRPSPVADAKPSATPLSSVERLLWVGLAACPSILWLGVANTLSQHVAPVPFLWILPLSIYLLSLILCFQSEWWYRRSIFLLALPAAWILMTMSVTSQGVFGLGWTIALFSIALLVCCMFCHGELARRKPPSEQLTSFYVMVALGGALGGVFVALAAPLLFNEFLELPIGIAMCVGLGLGLLYRYPLKRIVRLEVLGALGLAIAVQVPSYSEGTHLRIRNFYGMLQVDDQGSEDAAVRLLSNGPIRHGAQFLSPSRRGLATGYYGPNSGVAQALRAFDSRPMRVGVIGLGAGTLASYGRPGDVYRFYEINPAVIRVASSEFGFLSASRSTIEVVPGDARLALEREPRENFDVLVVDAFTGDSIPIHLLTREAFDLYFSDLKPDGILAVHVTNRYLDLSPVVQQLAAARGREARLIHSPEDPSREIYAADWVLVSSNPQVNSATPMPTVRGGRIWTDDYSNLLQVLR